MKREGMRKVAAMAAAFGFALVAQANPLEDSLFWWRGGRDGANGCVKDGFLTQGELVDTRHAKDTTFWNQSYSTLTRDGAAINALLPYQTETVTAPYARETYSAQTLYFPQTYTHTTNYSASGVATNVIWKPKQVSRLYLPKMFASATTAWTAFIRFRRDGVPEKDASIAESLMLVNYEWGSKRGIGINFLGTNLTQKTAKLRLSIGQYQPFPALTVTQGQWVDLALSVTGKVVTVCWCLPNGAFKSETYDTSTLSSVGDLSLSSSSYVHVGTDLNLSTTANAYAFDLATQKGKSLNNSMLAFRGAIAQLAFWNRALSLQEVREVFGYPRPAAMTAGLRDGGTGEYFATASSVLDGNGNWDDLNPALSAGETRTVTFTLTAAKATLPQLLRLFPATGSAAGALSLTLNGNVFSPAPFDGTHEFQRFVKAKFFKTGTNTLTIARTDAGSGTILIDALELTGSHIVGRKSTGNDVFSGEDMPGAIKAYDVSCGAETNLVRGVNPKKTYATGFSITFPLDDGLLKAMRGMTYHTRIVSYDSTKTFPPARFAMNGRVFKEYAANAFPAALGPLDFEIPYEYLKAGTNTFTFSADYIGGTTSKWRCFSFHEFEMRPLPQGSIMLLK